MADDRDIDALLRDAEASMSGPSTKRGRKSRPARRDPDAGLADRIDAAFGPAVAVAVVSGAAVWAFFLVVPFLGSISGGVGAFLATFVVSFFGRLRR